MSRITLTKEQQDILNAVKNGEKVIKIVAFAGTGKTFTLEQIALNNSNKSMLLLAYNKSIEKEAKKRFPKNVLVKTTHSYAYGNVVRKYGYTVRQTNYKATEIIELFKLNNINASYEFAQKILFMFELYCNSAAEHISHFASKGNTEVTEYAEKLFEKMKKGEIEITHSFYLKKFQLDLLRGEAYIKRYDIALLDEAQDTNDVTLSIFYLLNSTQKVVVGDRHQQIYSFRGSINAMSKIKASIYYLTKSFRFNQEIAFKATKFLQFFKAEKKYLIGAGTDIEIKNQAIITRTNAKLIAVMKRLIEEKKTFKIIRNPYSVFGLILNLKKLYTNKELDDGYKYLYAFKKQAKQEKIREDMLSYIKKIVEGQDIELETAIQTIRQTEDVYGIYGMAKEYYYDKNLKPDYYLTTAHTSKGLEWDKVTLESDFPCYRKIIEHYRHIPPHILSLKDDFYNDFAKDMQTSKVKQEIIDELNLYYVATTRAKVELEDRTLFSNTESYNAKSFSQHIKETLEKK